MKVFKYTYASMAEWSIAGDCKSPDFMSTLVQIQLGAQYETSLGFPRLVCICLGEIGFELVGGRGRRNVPVEEIIQNRGF